MGHLPTPRHRHLNAREPRDIESMIESDTDRTRWLLVTVSTGSSSTLRVHAWRKLRSLGALYLQNSVALLPERAETAREVAKLIERVRRSGGEGRVIPIAITDAEEEAAVTRQFRAERSDEYQEIASRVPAFLDEIASQRRRGRTTYAEVEESEADLEHLQKWLARVRSRDYFDAPGLLEAEQAIARCAAEATAFEAEAVAAELPGEPVASTVPRLRALDSE
jgi:chorismate mutase